MHTAITASWSMSARAPCATCASNCWHMESLPIRYFDTHAHGDIMSIYTNDVDTLRQLMSQSIPQIINSGVTIVTSFISMLVLDIPLTILTLAMIGVMAFVTSKIAAKSSAYFAKQQKGPGRRERLY